MIVVWALTRELRVLARLAESVESGENLGAALQKCGVWRSRQNIVRACVGRHSRAGFHAMIQASRIADAAAKGQMAGDAWQLATNLVWRLSADKRVAA